MTFQLLAEIALKSTLLLLAAWLVTCVLARSSAAVRHFVWTVALLGVLLLPFLVVFGPAWSMRSRLVTSLSESRRSIAFTAEIALRSSII